MADDKYLGQVFNDTYEVERQIGRGGMGVVYQVLHRRLVKRFALKMLSSFLVEDSQGTVRRFEREARITSSLGNPHIVEVFDFNRLEDGVPYFVMELLEGRDLASAQRERGRFDLTEVAQILAQVAPALQEAHDSGIIHRDLTPRNLFLCRKGNVDNYVKILDFGISKLAAVERQTISCGQRGTPRYMAPEQVLQGKEIGPAVDIFATGVILYEMLAGQPPFSGESIAATVHKIAYEPPAPISSLRPGLPSRLLVFFDRVLAKEPSRRPSSMRELLAEFLAAASVELPAIERPADDAEPLPAMLAAQPARGASLAVGGGPLTADLETTRPFTGPEPAAARRRTWWLLVGLGGVAVVLTLGVILLQRLGGVDGQHTLPPADAQATVTVQEDARQVEAVIDARSAGAGRDSTTTTGLRRRLWLTSRPLHAAAFLDGRRLGRTPLVGVEIPAAAARLSVRRQGYVPWHHRLPAATADARLQARLRRMSRRGSATLRIVSVRAGEPFWMDVEVDGVARGRTPLSIRVSSGRHRVRVSRAGHRSQIRPLLARAGKQHYIVFRVLEGK